MSSRRKAASAEEADAPAVATVASAAATAAPAGRSRARAAAADEAEAPATDTPSTTAVAPAGRPRRAAAAAEEAEAAAPAAADAAQHVDPNAAAAPAAAAGVRQRRVAAARATDEAAAGGDGKESSAPRGGSAAAAMKETDYDSMTYEAFLAHLNSRSKRDVVEALKQRSLRETEDRKSEKDIETFTDSSGGYQYQVLLDRVYDELRRNNPSLTSTEGSRNQIPVPAIERYGSKKTAVANFKAICDAIHRSMEEVKDFIDKELSTTGSIDSSNCLILKLQNVKSIQFEGIIIKYIDEFVKCHSCKKINSTLQKEDRITVLKCNLCQASRTVTQGGSAFHAVTGKRAKLRAANAL